MSKDNQTDKEFLVEIRVRDWVEIPEGKSRIITYEEVLAPSAYEALYAGFKQYLHRIQYEPIARRKFEALGITTRAICAPDAVEL